MQDGTQITAVADSLRPSAKRHCGAMSIAVSGAALGTRSNFIIAADRIRRCLIATTSSGIASFGSLTLIVEKSRPSCGRYST
jgi:hypothetical protein